MKKLHNVADKFVFTTVFAKSRDLLRQLRIKN